MSDEKLRKLVGLAIGTSWIDEDEGVNREISGAKHAESEGIKHVQVEFGNYPPIPAERFWAFVSSGRYTPNGIDAYSALGYVKEVKPGE